MKHIIQNSIGSFVYFFGLWAITMVISKVSRNGYHDVGIFTLSMSFCNVFLPLATLCARGYQVTDINHQYSDGHYVALRYATASLSLLLCVAVAFALGYREATLAAIVLFMLYKTSEAYADVLYGICQKNGHLEYAAFSLAAKGVAGVFAFAVVLQLTQSLIVSMTAMVGVALAFILSYDRPKAGRFHSESLSQFVKLLPQTRPLLFACLPLMLNSFIVPVMLLVPRLMVENIYSTEMLGIYTSVTFPSVVVSTLANAAAVALVPRYAEAWRGGGRKPVILLLMFPLALAGLCGVVGVPFAYWCGGLLLKLLYTAEISGYVDLLAIAVVVSCILTCVVFCNYMLIAMRRAKKMLLFSGIACAVVLAGSFPFVQRWNMHGAACILGLAYLVQLAAQLAYLAWRISTHRRSVGKGDPVSGQLEGEMNADTEMMDTIVRCFADSPYAKGK